MPLWEAPWNPFGFQPYERLKARNHPIGSPFGRPSEYWGHGRQVVRPQHGCPAHARASGNLYDFTSQKPQNRIKPRGCDEHEYRKRYLIECFLRAIKQFLLQVRSICSSRPRLYSTYRSALVDPVNPRVSSGAIGLRASALELWKRCYHTLRRQSAKDSMPSIAMNKSILGYRSRFKNWKLKLSYLHCPSLSGFVLRICFCLLRAAIGFHRIK